MREIKVPRPESISLKVNGKTLTGIRHRVADEDAPIKLFCLHGWLDNANSFLPLMSLLPEIDLVAIDMPGHGFSDHLESTYTIPDAAYWAAAAIKALGWERCHVAGHSLGGIVSSVLAVSAPDMVESLILIDASGALASETDVLVERLQASMRDQLADNKFESKVYASKDDAVDARLRAAKMATTSAKLIVDRQLRECEGGWQWRFDPKLRLSTAHRFTEEQVREINRSIPCRVLTIVAKEGFLASREETPERLSLIPNHQPVSLAGNHHLHMDTPEPVSAAINQFLGTRPALGG